jgi:hypothetical protein
MLLRPATRNCGRNISPLFRIAAAKLQDAKFRALPHSGSSNGPLPLLQVQLRPLPPLFITLLVAWVMDEQIDHYSITNGKECRWLCVVMIFYFLAPQLYQEIPLAVEEQHGHNHRLIKKLETPLGLATNDLLLNCF